MTYLQAGQATLMVEDGPDQMKKPCDWLQAPAGEPAPVDRLGACDAGTLEHPSLATVVAWTVSTDDMHRLYAKFGFAPLVAPSKTMNWRGESVD